MFVRLESTWFPRDLQIKYNHIHYSACVVLSQRNVCNNTNGTLKRLGLKCKWRYFLQGRVNDKCIDCTIHNCLFVKHATILFVWYVPWNVSQWDFLYSPIPLFLSFLVLFFFRLPVFHYFVCSSSVSLSFLSYCIFYLWLMTYSCSILTFLLFREHNYYYHIWKSDCSANQMAY